MDVDGCIRFNQFIKNDYLTDLRRETESLAPQALFSIEEYTPYGTPPDYSFPDGHPRNNTHRTTSGNVTRDLIPKSTLIQQIYLNPLFQRFIADCLEALEIFPFRDPMRGLIINAMPNNTTLGWHFDANEFVVSLMTKKAEQGGGSLNIAPISGSPVLKTTKPSRQCLTINVMRSKSLIFKLAIFRFSRAVFRCIG